MFDNFIGFIGQSNDEELVVLRRRHTQGTKALAHRDIDPVLGECFSEDYLANDYLHGELFVLIGGLCVNWGTAEVLV